MMAVGHVPYISKDPAKPGRDKMTIYKVLRRLSLANLVELQWLAYQVIVQRDSSYYTDAHELHATIAGVIRYRVENV